MEDHISGNNKTKTKLNQIEQIRVRYQKSHPNMEVV